MIYNLTIIINKILKEVKLNMGKTNKRLFKDKINKNKRTIGRNSILVESGLREFAVKFIGNQSINKIDLTNNLNSLADENIKEGESFDLSKVCDDFYSIRCDKVEYLNGIMRYDMTVKC